MGLSTSKKKKRIKFKLFKIKKSSSKKEKKDESRRLSSIKEFFNWDSTNLSKYMTITDDSSTVTKIGKPNKSETVRSSVGFQMGKHVFRVTWPIEKRGEDLAVIGFSTTPTTVEPQIVCGKDEMSFGLDLIDNSIVFNNSRMNTNADEELPDTFIVILDLVDGWCIFKLESKLIKISLKEFKDYYQSKQLYFVTSMNKDGGRVTVNMDWRNPSILLDENSPTVLDTICMKKVYELSIQESWLHLKSLLNRLNLSDKNLIKSMICKNMQLFQTYSNMKESSLEIYSADDNIKVIIRYYELLSRHLQEDGVDHCFRWMTVFLYCITNYSLKNKDTAEENGILRIIYKVLKSLEFRENPVRYFYNLLFLIC